MPRNWVEQMYLDLQSSALTVKPPRLNFNFDVRLQACLYFKKLKFIFIRVIRLELTFSTWKVDALPIKLNSLF